MMATSPDEFELLIDRAVCAVRELSVPSGPPADVVEKVRLAGLTASAQHTESVERIQSSSATSSTPLILPGAVSVHKAKFMRSRNLAALAAAGILIILATQLLPTRPYSNFAFAQVQEQVGKTKSVQYTETFTQRVPNGKPYPTLIEHVKILGNRLMRNEMDIDSNHDEKVSSSFLGPWGRSVEITDLVKKKKATLYPEVRGYMIMDWGGTFANAYVLSPKDEKILGEKAAAQKNIGKKGRVKEQTDTFVADSFDWDLATPAPQLDIYELIRHVPSDRAKKLHEKNINGKRVVGFLVEQDDRQQKGTTKWRHTWWVNPTTKLPVQLEISWRSGDSKESGSGMVVSNIVFDAPLNPALFSIDLPAGYVDLGPAAMKAREQGQAIAKNPNRMNTLQFTQVENMKTTDGRKAPELVKRVTILDNHLKREEVTTQSVTNSEISPPAGIVPHVSIQNAKQGKTIVLLPDKKQFLDPAKTSFTADYIQWIEKQTGHAKRAGKTNVYAALNFPDNKSTRLPLKLIDGQLAFGKYAEEKSQRGKYLDSRKWTIWLDPFTMQFIRVDASLRSTDPSIGEVDYVLREFSEYAPVDKTLFSTEPPPGWTGLSEKPAQSDQPSTVRRKPGK